MTQIREIMTTNPVSLSGDRPMREAADAMRRHGVGDVLVMNGDGELVGMVTDRDLVVRGLARGKTDATLEELCTSELVTLSPDEEVDQAVALMGERAIRRIPVTENGKACGIVSLGDLAIERDRESALGRISAASTDA